MQQEGKIFERLSNHETPPPPGLESSIMSAFENSRPATETPVELPGLEGLAEIVTDPPSAVTATILGNYFDHSTKQSFFRAHRWKFFAAASVIVVFILFYATSTQRQEKARLLAGDKKNPVIAPAEKTTTGLQADPLPTDTVVSGRIISGPATKNHRFSINGQYAALQQNEIWYSLLGQDDQQQGAWPSLPQKTTILLRIDEFTQIQLSPAMAAAINETRETKKNGKPSFRAKRTRRKLEKLKQREESFFRIQKNNNPLNPIQLSKFMDQ